MAGESRDPSALDPVVHQPVRLAVLSLLATGYEADFNFLRHALAVTDGNLASHLRVLEDAGYVEVDKRFVGRRPNTLYRLTPAGRTAFAGYREAIGRMIGLSDGPTFRGR